MGPALPAMPTSRSARSVDMCGRCLQDFDGKGELEPDEFADAWKYLKLTINKIVTDKIGLSDLDIAFVSRTCSGVV